MTTEQFMRKCNKAAVAGETSVFFVDDRPAEENSQYEDDGALHVKFGGCRAVFDVGDGQSNSGAEQNRKTRLVMEALGMKRKINDNVLVEECDDDEDDVCPHCGR